MKYPNATIQDFDVSDEQFSPLYTISDVRLVVHNCFKEFPAEFVDQYDIVHARFWLSLVNNSDSPVLFKNLISLLGGSFLLHPLSLLLRQETSTSNLIGLFIDHGPGPADYLQLFEPLAKSVSLWKPDPSMPSLALDQHCRVRAKPKPYTTSKR